LRLETFDRSCWCDDDDDDVIVFVVVSLVCLLRYSLPRFRVSSSSTFEERVSAHVRTAVAAAAEEEEEEDFVSPFSPLKRLESDLNADLTEFVTFKCR
jgi:hypothetical protein